MKYGLTERYAEADLKELHKATPKNLQSMAAKFLKMTRNEFYLNGYNFYIYGVPCSGKSYVAHAIVNHIADTFQERSIYYISMPTLYSYFLKDSERNDGTKWISYLAGMRVLVIDDLGREYRSNKGFIETKLDNFLRYRFSKKRATILVGTLSIASLEKAYGTDFATFVDSEYIVLESSEKVNMSKIIRKEFLQDEKSFS